MPAAAACVSAAEPRAQEDSQGAGNGERVGEVLVMAPPKPTLSGSAMAAPRHIAIRSRVLMQRTPAGAKGVVPPKELLPVGHLGIDTAVENGIGKNRCTRRTQFVGDGLLEIPIELVALSTQSAHHCEGKQQHSKPSTRRRKPCPKALADANASTGPLEHLQRVSPEAHQRKLRTLLRELWDAKPVLAPLAPADTERASVMLDMAELSRNIKRGVVDPFCEVHTAVLCQKLGLLKKKVAMNGPYRLVHFDPTLLVKARRVLQMQTYSEVRHLASSLLTRFDHLLQVLIASEADQLAVDPREHVELRQAVLELESVWAECQFILQQGSLDFIQQLISFLPSISDMRRWQLRVAMTEAAAANAPSEEVQLARATLFETLPILVYVEEVWRDVRAERSHGKAGTCVQYRELFCPKDDRHYTLRRDFAKFDDQRFQRFRAFLLGEEVEGGDKRQRHYFQLVHKQLKEIAAFPVHDSPSTVLCNASGVEVKPNPKAARSDLDDFDPLRRQRAREAHARWVCVQRVAQAVQPELFPCQSPLETTTSSPSKSQSKVTWTTAIGDEASPVTRRNSMLPGKGQAGNLARGSLGESLPSRSPRTG